MTLAKMDLEELSDALEPLRCEMASYADRLRLRSCVREVGIDLRVQYYRTGSALEGYVDVELCSGGGVSWWMEVHDAPGGWVLERRITAVGADGQSVVKDWPDVSAENLHHAGPIAAAALESLPSLDAYTLNLPELALPA